jgi:hypothetical protein
MGKADDDRLAKLQTRREQIENEIQAIEARKKKEEEKRTIQRITIVGKAVLAHAASNPDFAKTLSTILNNEVNQAIDKKAIADLLSLATETEALQTEGPAKRPETGDL